MAEGIVAIIALYSHLLATEFHFLN